MMVNYCILKLSCNLDMVGWISGGGYFLVVDGMVIRMVCMYWFFDCCYYLYMVEI